MTRDECKRRLRALIAMPAKERPFSIGLLEKLTGISNTHLRRDAAELDGMYREKHRQLDRAFTLLENGQAELKTGYKRRGIPYKAIVHEEPRPVQSMLTRIRMTERGPVLDFIAVNRAAFPVLPQTFK
jgi:hypothetical protein